MNWRDKEKLIKRGFIIIRERDYIPISGNDGIALPYQVFYCSGNSSWKLLKDYRYRTKSKRRKAMDILLKFDNHIED